MIFLERNSIFLRIVFFVLVILIALSVAFPAAAQGLLPCDGINCEACHIAALIQNIIRFLILLAIPVAAVLFAVAGFIYFTSGGDTGRVAKAHGIFKDVAIGFIIVLASWLIVETLLRTVLKPAFFGGWNTLKCVGTENRLIYGRITPVSDPAIQAVRPGAVCNQRNAAGECVGGWTYDPGGLTPITYTQPGGKPIPETERVRFAAVCIEEGSCRSHDEAMQILRDAGVKVTSSGQNVREDCSPWAYLGCTSIHGIRAGTLDMVLQYKRECNCDLVITGGTESDAHAKVYGPGQHIYGDKVDFAHTGNLDAWFSKNEGSRIVKFDTKTTSSGTYEYFCDTSTGNVWTRERVTTGPHYDVRAGGCQQR